jgi:LmbE family N-acetylglucosaminyl deacetylase
MKRPPIGAVWGSVQRLSARTAPEELLPGGALFLSPHEDDETIGCGLLLAEKTGRGIPVSVAVATDGRAGWFSTASRPPPDEIVDIRRAEWHRALDALAVPRAQRFALGFRDGELTGHESELVQRLGGLLRETNPSQVFVTRPGDPHPDHRTLARAVERAVVETYAPRGVTSGNGPSPRVFTYRVYPGEGLWTGDRPSHTSVGAVVGQFIRSVIGLRRNRPLLLRSPRSMAQKSAAVDAYESQRRLMNGELRYVWKASFELYWPLDVSRLANSPPM